ncbi:MAG: hypothetical protein AAGF55_02035 [Pseudomonadota bacterium]
MKKNVKAKMPRRSWTSGRGALGVIALLLVASGIIRLSTGAGSAIALEIKEQAEQQMAKASEPDIVDIAPDLVALLEQAQTRQRKLDQREAELETRMQALALIEGAVAEDLERLEDAEAKLRATMASADAAAETDIGRLTAVYENMKPAEAAALFQLMEPSFAAGFLGRMRADAAAAILAGLKPDLAYSISVVLAGRNANVPREPVPEAQEPDPE